MVLLPMLCPENLVLFVLVSSLETPLSHGKGFVPIIVFAYIQDCELLFFTSVLAYETLYELVLCTAHPSTGAWIQVSQWFIYGGTRGAGIVFMRCSFFCFHESLVIFNHFYMWCFFGRLESVEFCKHMPQAWCKFGQDGEEAIYVWKICALFVVDSNVLLYW